MFIDNNVGKQFNSKRNNSSFNMVGFTKHDGNFSKNTYIWAENFTNHLQSKGKEKAKEHYKNNKERLQEQARNKYREWSNEEKNKK